MTGEQVKISIRVVEEHRDRQIEAATALIERANKEADARIAQLREQCQHEDDGSMFHGFCKFCGEGGA